MKNKILSLLTVLTMITGTSAIAQIYFPNLNNGFPVNNAVQAYTFKLTGFCSMTNSSDTHSIFTSTNSGLNPYVASGVTIQYKITSIICSSNVTCLQTGTVPVAVGNIYQFTPTAQVFVFTSPVTATVTGDIMIVGTPTVLNEPYECGYFLSFTLGNCGNTGSLNGLKKTISSFSLCNVGVSNAINEKIITTGFSFYPNPAKNSLTFSNENYSVLNAQIINVIGEKIKEFKVETGNRSVDISDLSSGTYYINLSDGYNVISSEKLIIIK